MQLRDYKTLLKLTALTLFAYSIDRKTRQFFFLEGAVFSGKAAFSVHFITIFVYSILIASIGLVDKVLASN